MVQSNEARRYGGIIAVALCCAACSAGAPAPDLRESRVALRLDNLWTTLHEWSLLSRGMPPFDELTQEQVRHLHAYIRAGAREVLGVREATRQVPVDAAPR